MPLMLRVEFHCHTIFSKDCLLSPAGLVESCRRKGISRVIVTDHNRIAGAVAAHAIDPVRVVIGEEIMTSAGELLAAFVKEEVPAGLSPHLAIQRLREQEAFISVSHPFDRWRKGAWSEGDLRAIAPLVDAIEVFNSRCLSDSCNKLAADFARRQNLVGTVGSDAHTAWELGRSTLLLPEFETADDLRRVMADAIADIRLSPSWIHLSSRFARLYKAINRRLDMS